MWSRSLDVAAVCYRNLSVFFFLFLIIIITSQFQEKKKMSIHVTQSFSTFLIWLFIVVSFRFYFNRALKTHKKTAVCFF
jgi:uncharacterized membrane protein